MNDLITQILLILGFINLILLPFLILLLKDIRKLSYQIKEAISDGKIDPGEMDQILGTVGRIFQKIYYFWFYRKNDK